MSSSEEEKDFDANDESSEDEPLTNLSKKKKSSDEDSPSRKRRASKSAVSYAEDEEAEEEEESSGDSSEDEDVPLSALKGNSPKKKAPPKKKTPAKTKKTTPKKKVKTTPKKQDAAPTSKYISASSVLYGSDCDKGMLIQNLLCRWWYAIAWPNPAAVPDKPPENCDALDGFPGVYIQTSGDDVGQIVDLRDKEKAPSFNNLARKSSEELQALLVKALEEQTRQLVEAEGKGTETEKELNKLLKWAKKIKGGKADKEAVKVLKAKKLTID